MRQLRTCGSDGSLIRDSTSGRTHLERAELVNEDARRLEVAEEDAVRVQVLEPSDEFTAKELVGVRSFGGSSGEHVDPE